MVLPNICEHVSTAFLFCKDEQCMIKGGDCHMKRTGMLVGTFWIKPLKDPNLGVAQALFNPYK